MPAQLLTSSGDGRYANATFRVPPCFGLGPPCLSGSGRSCATCARPATSCTEGFAPRQCCLQPVTVSLAVGTVIRRTCAAAPTACHQRLSAVHPDVVCRSLTNIMHDMHCQHGRRCHRCISRCSDVKGFDAHLVIGGTVQGAAGPREVSPSASAPPSGARPPILVLCSQETERDARHKGQAVREAGAHCQHAGGLAAGASWGALCALRRLLFDKCIVRRRAQQPQLSHNMKSPQHQPEQRCACLSTWWLEIAVQIAQITA